MGLAAAENFDTPPRGFSPGPPSPTEPTPYQTRVFRVARGSGIATDAWGNPVSDSFRTPQGAYPDPKTVNLIEDAWSIFAAVHQQMTAVCIATDMMIRSSHVSVRAIQDVMLSNAMAAELHDTAGKFFARIKELLAIELEARSESTRGYLFPADEDGEYSREGGRR